MTFKVHNTWSSLVSASTKCEAACLSRLWRQVTNRPTPKWRRMTWAQMGAVTCLGHTSCLEGECHDQVDKELIVIKVEPRPSCSTPSGQLLYGRLWIGCPQGIFKLSINELIMIRLLVVMNL
jgi:hypothetical protein